MASIQPLQGTLGFQNAKHLLGRASYLNNKARINQFAGYTVTQAMDALFGTISWDLPEPLHRDTGQPYIPTYTQPNPAPYTVSGEEAMDHIIWWLRNAEKSGTIHFKLSAFLHSIYAAYVLYDVQLDYITMLVYYSTRSISELAKKITRSNAMLIYLNGDQNTKFTPNENYAREFLELFTIMKGPQDGPSSYTNYTEQDVQMAARVLSGYKTIGFSERMTNLDPVCKVPLGKKYFPHHDTTNKVFSAKFGNQGITGAVTESQMDGEIDAFINMVFAQPETAKAYARRIYRFFVKAEITTEIETDIIAPLSANLLSNNYSLTTALRLLLSAQHFYDEDDAVSGDDVIGSKIKDPLELCLQLVNQLGVSTAAPTANTKHFWWYYKNLHLLMTRCGFNVWQPASVAGYTPYHQQPYHRLWVTSATLRNRYDLFIDFILGGFTENGYTTVLNTALFVRNSGYFTNPANATLLVDEMLEYLLVEKPAGARLSVFQQSLLGGLSFINWQHEWNNYLSTNNESAVRSALDRLIKTIVKSKEYQVF